MRKRTLIFVLLVDKQCRDKKKIRIDFSCSFINEKVKCRTAAFPTKCSLFTLKEINEDDDDERKFDGRLY